jgi:hypothetical protein
VLCFLKSKKLSLFLDFVDCVLIVVRIEHGEERSKGFLCLNSRVALRQSKATRTPADGVVLASNL